MKSWASKEALASTSPDGDLPELDIKTEARWLYLKQSYPKIGCFKRLKTENSH
jgi:hypothetical protein